MTLRVDVVFDCYIGRIQPKQLASPSMDNMSHMFAVNSLPSVRTAIRRPLTSSLGAVSLVANDTRETTFHTESLAPSSPSARAVCTLNTSTKLS